MSLFRRLFNKPDMADIEVNLGNSEFTFAIRLDSLIIGYLSAKKGNWYFSYSDEFKKQDKYHRLVGFSNLDKIYKSDVLWPFFKVRIPGLKQPMIMEIIEKESIDKSNEVDLLKRFGKINISNPYILDPLL